MSGELQADGVLKVYEPPIEEFSIAVAEVGAGAAYTFNGVGGPSIFLVYEGEGEVVGEDGFALASGSVVFVAADREMHVKAGAQGLRMARCEGEGEGGGGGGG